MDEVTQAAEPLAADLNTEVPEAPVTEAAPEAQAAPEATMPAPTSTAPGTFAVWKPLPEEFSLDVEFAAIAADLSLPIESVHFTVTPEVQNGVDGHTLSGVAA